MEDEPVTFRAILLAAHRIPGDVAHYELNDVYEFIIRPSVVAGRTRTIVYTNVDEPPPFSLTIRDGRVLITKPMCPFSCANVFSVREEIPEDFAVEMKIFLQCLKKLADFWEKQKVRR